MPLNGNTYVAPTWRNGGPPALDAAELQAISDSLEKAGLDVGSLQSNMSSVQAVVAALQTGKAQIEVGSYVGTGTYGPNNPCSITCSFAPKLFIVGANGSDSNRFELYGIAINPGPYMSAGYKTNSMYSNYKNKITWRNNGISWYSLSQVNAQFQYNDSEATYYWAVIGQSAVGVN